MGKLLEIFNHRWKAESSRNEVESVARCHDHFVDQMHNAGNVIDTLMRLQVSHFVGQLLEWIFDVPQDISIIASRPIDSNVVEPIKHSLH